MNNLKQTALIAALGFFSANALAADKAATVSMEQISSKSAFILAQETVNQCEAKGYKVSATVVDPSGNVIAQLRSDGAGVHTLDSSRQKAFTSASMRQPTGNLMKLIAEKPIMQPLQNMNENLLFLEGALPIEINGKVVGAIGVGGAPGGHLDAACAEDAMKKVL